MRPLIPSRFVSLIGLPGSGKTTLCRSLAEALGWEAFVIGDALRARAKSDHSLKEMLDHGELAPESVAIELMREAAKDAAARGLIIDGFPRHKDQVALAKELFNPWVVLHLSIPVSAAESRLRERKYCSVCNWAGPITNQNSNARCPQCGSTALRVRPEDSPGVLSRRLSEAKMRLDELLNLLERNTIRIDAIEPRDAVVEKALVAVRHGQ